MDFIERLSRSEGKDSMLVIVDKLTKFAYFVNLTHPFTAQEVAKQFLDSVVKIHGVPKSIVSKKGQDFY